MKNSKPHKIRWSLIIFITPVLLWLFLLIVFPQLELLKMSFFGTGLPGPSNFTLTNYSAFFKEPIYWLTFVRTALYSISVTFLVLLVSLPLTFYITKIAKIKTQGFLTMVVLIPFWISELIQIYGWIILLRQSGIINQFLVKIGIFSHPHEMLYNDVTMIMGLVYISMLFMIVPLMGVMQSLDDSLIEAAYDLGAKKVTIWRKIIIPYVPPGIMSGSILVFMLVLGSYLTPKLMGGKNALWFTEQIYNSMIIYFNWNQGAAFGFLLLLLSSLIIFIMLKITKQDFRKVIK